MSGESALERAEKGYLFSLMAKHSVLSALKLQ